MDPVSVASLVLNALLLLGGGVAYLTRHRQATATQDATHEARINAMGTEIRDLKTRISEVTEGHELVVRLDERLKGLERTLREQPQTIALCVGEAMKAAFKFMPARVG